MITVTDIDQPMLVDVIPAKMDMLVLLSAVNMNPGLAMKADLVS